MNYVEQFKQFRHDLAIAETMEELKSLETRAAAAAEFARRAKVAIDVQNEWGDYRIDIETKKGVWLEKHFPAKVNANDRPHLSDGEMRNMKSVGVGFQESVNARLILKEPDRTTKAKEIIKKQGKIITPYKVANEVRRQIKIERHINPPPPMPKKVTMSNTAFILKLSGALREVYAGLDTIISNEMKITKGETEFLKVLDAVDKKIQQYKSTHK